MATCLLPALRNIRRAFVEEVTKLGGNVLDTFDDGNVLFLRSTFPRSECVRPQDTVNRGVALRANARDVFVHPYVFREVCRNGAIMARTADSQQVERVEPSASREQIDEVLEDVRAVVRASASEEVFHSSLRAMRRAAAMPGEVDMLISVAAMFSGTESHPELVRMLLQDFADGNDPSHFGVMNAVTSVARETRDQETRWRLEELGGGALATLPPAPTPLDAAVAGCC